MVVPALGASIFAAGCQSAPNASTSGKAFGPQCNWHTIEAGLCRGGYRHP
jgi:hypothetical protein